MKAKLDKIINILKESSLRVTSSRLAVAEIFIKNEGKYLTPEETYKLIQKSKGISADQVSVYRILAKFEELGILYKGEFHKDAARYTLNQEKSKRHQHYFKCISCDTIESFSDCFIHKKEKELEKKGYGQLSHHLEITGLCPSCN